MDIAILGGVIALITLVGWTWYDLYLSVRTDLKQARARKDHVRYLSGAWKGSPPSNRAGHPDAMSMRKARLDEPSDPVYSDKNGWWFYDETWSTAYGPFDDEEAARTGLNTYAETL